ncbi:MAG: ABC transporter ATP-binding protein [Nitrososphaerota archaeon]|nr:ABC transporter ATP-binding protein [Nitrososphaerota archaeon]
MGLALEVRNIRKSFGNLLALDDISFGAEEKTLTILMGPNGSGKTTLINVIGGLYKPDSGKVLFRGKDITGLAPHKIYRMGLARTFQIPALFLQLTVLENVMVARKDNPGENFTRSIIKRYWRDEEEKTAERAFEILAMVGLSHMWDKSASVLSGGQLKLLEIGRALMSNANTVLLDEPISGVNPTLAHEIFSTLVRLRDNYGMTFLIIEHRLDIALSYVDSVIAMAYGKFLVSGTAQEVTSDKRVIEAYLGG